MPAFESRNISYDYGVDAGNDNPPHQYHQYIQATPLMRELLGRRPPERARTVRTIRVGNRHGGRTNRQEVITGVINRPLRVSSPVNSHTAEVGVYLRRATQTDRIATGGERWHCKHPPPCPLQSAGELPMSASFVL